MRLWDVCLSVVLYVRRLSCGFLVCSRCWNKVCQPGHTHNIEILRFWSLLLGFNWQMQIEVRSSLACVCVCVAAALSLRVLHFFPNSAILQLNSLKKNLLHCLSVQTHSWNGFSHLTKCYKVFKTTLRSRKSSFLILQVRHMCLIEVWFLL